MACPSLSSCKYRKKFIASHQKFCDYEVLRTVLAAPVVSWGHPFFSHHVRSCILKNEADRFTLKSQKACRHCVWLDGLVKRTAVWLQAELVLFCVQDLKAAARCLDADARSEAGVPGWLAPADQGWTARGCTKKLELEGGRHRMISLVSHPTTFRMRWPSTGPRPLRLSSRSLSSINSMFLRSVGTFATMPLCKPSVSRCTAYSQQMRCAGETVH